MLLLMGCSVGCSTYRSTHKLRFNDDVETDMFACVPDPNSNDKRDKLCVDIATYNAMLIQSFMEKMKRMMMGMDAMA